MVKIVVLEDGTWAGSGQTMVITDDAYERLCEGDKISDLDDTDDVIRVDNIITWQEEK